MTFDPVRIAFPPKRNTRYPSYPSIRSYGRYPHAPSCHDRHGTAAGCLFPSEKSTAKRRGKLWLLLSAGQGL
jgi:hypothetical protein